MFNVSYIHLGAVAFLLLWGLGTLKTVLFWLYLWQLKDYHIGRFTDHFRTSKGKRALLNITVAVKMLLVIWLSGVYIFNDWGYLIWGAPAFLLIYSVETYRTIISLVRGSAKKPVFTKKMILLFSIVIVVMAGFFHASYRSEWDFSILLLLFDICVPIIVSVIVLAIQPFFVIARTFVLNKARKKMSGFKNLTVIGITGSYGKTSTKEFLHTILSSKFNVLATPEHKNSEMGIAQTILNDLRPEHQVFIVEMGAYNKGGIQLLCNMARPNIGIVTGVNEQHLSTFGSLESLLSAEGGRELVECLPGDGLMVVNGDNKYCLDLYKKTEINKRIYTLKKDKIDSDVWTEDVLVEKEKVSFIAVSRDKEMDHFQVNVLGGHNIQNMLGAITVAKELGMTMQEIAQASQNIKPEQAGIALKDGVHGISIIDSSYSSNPDGVVADLNYLNVFGGKKIIVMPCLIELGSKSAQIHEQLGGKMAQICDLAIITTKDKFNEVSTGFINERKMDHKIIFCDKPKDIFATITTMCKEGDAVLLEGRVPGELIKLLEK